MPPQIKHENPIDYCSVKFLIVAPHHLDVRYFRKIHSIERQRTLAA